jgi:tRNA(Ile2)-agmatinylcytidine synthase
MNNFLCLKVKLQLQRLAHSKVMAGRHCFRIALSVAFIFKLEYFGITYPMTANLTEGANYDEFNDQTVLHIGFDNTDSTRAGCTTHLAFRIISYLVQDKDVQFVDYPLLIRLNPNIPWKTRGNGAICLRIASKKPESAIEYIKNTILAYSDIKNGANPGLAVLKNTKIPESVRHFSYAALYKVLNIHEASKLAEKESISYFKYGNGHGLIGALAAVGSLLEGDHTFESISYRKENKLGTLRQLDKQTVIQMNLRTFPRTFNNVDPQRNRILISPRGPDPVFCGIRGEDPGIVIKSLLLVNPSEKLDGYAVFRTNQGTNVHLQNRLSLSEVRPYMAGHTRGTICRTPMVIQGGHVLFEICDAAGDSYPVAVYEPTSLGVIASRLITGDLIEIGYGVRPGDETHAGILNVEFLSILSLKAIVLLINPVCKKCEKRMKSEGRRKGFQCERCKSKTFDKCNVTQPRNLIAGMYLPVVRSHRHLTKPIQRFGQENYRPYLPGAQSRLHSNWYSDAQVLEDMLRSKHERSGGLI